MILRMVQAKAGCVLTVLLALVFSLPSARGQTSTLTCKKCDRVASLDSCTGSQKCADNEICYMDELITDQLTVVYTGGCRSTVVCNSGVGGSPSIGKRGLQKRSDLVACSRCCDIKKKHGELDCNARLCGITYSNTSSSRCYLCDNLKGDAEQGDVDIPEDCVSETTCKPNEACGAERLDFSGKNSHKYTCLPKRICTLLTKEALKRKDECVTNPDPNICGPGKRAATNQCTACCGDGLCNSGSCEQVLDRLYNLWKGGALDFDTLRQRQAQPPTIKPDCGGAIPNCSRRHCTGPSQAVCDECLYDNVFYKRTHFNTRCEQMCSFNLNTCWPGECLGGLINGCRCLHGFHLHTTTSATNCSLNADNTPTISSCQLRMHGAHGEERHSETNNTCQSTKDFYGNIEPVALEYKVSADFIVDTLSFIKPTFINDSNFGITDATVFLRKTLKSGSDKLLMALQEKTGTNRSLDVVPRWTDARNITLSQDKLENGERLCLYVEAFGGGYVRPKDFRTNTVLEAVPYHKTNSTEVICYRYDNSRPKHCLETNSCVVDTRGPLYIGNRITRDHIINVEFKGWLDPEPKGAISGSASGIQSYEISVREVLSDGNISAHFIFKKKMNASETSLKIDLQKQKIGLYCISINVTDFADNIQQARRFVLYDNSSYISTRNDKTFIITSAIKASNFTWQSNKTDVCLNWTDHFYNSFYFQTSLLGPISRDQDGHINGIYEQESGVLPVKGTDNVFGIIQFRLSWSQNGGPFSAEVVLQGLFDQTYCKNFSFIDGQSYNFKVEAVDIVGNNKSDIRTVYIDTSPPVVKIVGLNSNDNSGLFIHTGTAYSPINISFIAIDRHSGIHNIEWDLRAVNTGQKLSGGFIGVTHITQERCPYRVSNCYCPLIGRCELFNHTIQLDGLTGGNNNQTYRLTITVTNNALLTTREHREIEIIDTCSQCPPIDRCLSKCCSTNGISVCSDCANGYHVIKGNSSCFDLMSNFDVICQPTRSDHCYVIFKYQLSWLDAKGICQARNGQLFVPESTEEEMFLEKYLNTVGAYLHYSEHSFWIGVRSDGSGRNLWLDTKGNGVESWANVLHRNETSCIAMEGQANFLWNNFQCDKPQFFICKESTLYSPAQPQPTVG